LAPGCSGRREDPAPSRNRQTEGRKRPRRQHGRGQGRHPSQPQRGRTQERRESPSVRNHPWFIFHCADPELDPIPKLKVISTRQKNKLLLIETVITRNKSLFNKVF